MIDTQPTFRRLRRAAWILPLAALALPVAVQAASRFLLLEGTTLTGIGDILRIEDAVVNSSGRWAATVTTDQADPAADQALLLGGAVYLQEGDALADPPGASVDYFGPVQIDDAGNLLHILLLQGTSGTGDDTALYRNQSVLLREGDVSSATGFGANTTYRSFLNVKANGAGTRLALLAAVDDPTVPGPLDLAVVRVDLNGAGQVTGETVVAKQGDVLPGQTRAVASFGTWLHQLDVNEAGEIIFFADLVGDEATDGVIYKDGTLLAQEGSPSPVAGRNYETLSSRALALDDVGGHAFRADLDLATTDDDVLIQNGALARAEGSDFEPTFPGGITGFGPTNGPVALAGDGALVWIGQEGNFRYVARGGSTVIRQLFDQIEGNSVTAVGSGPGTLAVAASNEWVLYRATTSAGTGVAIGLDPASDAPAVSAPKEAFLTVFPNPVLDRAQVRFALGRQESVELDVFDVTGRRVATLDAGVRSAGEHVITWSGADARGRRVAPGTYFVRLRTGDRVLRSRVTWVR